MREVLVVDDEEDVRDWSVILFKDMGYTVHAASQGREALDILAQHPSIALLYTDIRMPVMSGTDLASQARKLYPDLKIIFVTGYAAELTTLPGVPILRKPFLPHDLVEIVQNTMGSRR